MSDHFDLKAWKSLQAESGRWFKAIELLGTGGNAATFLAYCTSQPYRGLLFAIKVFRRLSKPERRHSFLDEAKFLRVCVHPAIMRVFDEGTYYDDNPFIVVEHLPRTLADEIRSGCSFIEKVAYSFQLLSALDYLASQSPPVAHRDIKPANIFIKGGACVLGDFGLMKRLGGDSDEDKSILKESIDPGMPFYYRTPDLVDYLNGTSALTVKTDVFQLGLVLAHLFTGRNPAKFSTDFASRVELEPLGNIPSKMSGQIASVLKRMLNMKPDKRPSASDLVNIWEKIFKNVVNAAHEIEDRAFVF